MTRNLRALGLALLAAFALGALAVSAASAHTFKSENAPVTLHATQVSNQTFTVTGHSVVCKNATFHGSSTNKANETVTLSPTYTNCTFGELEAAVTVPSTCNFVLHSATPTTNMALVDIECNHGGPIVINVGGICEIRIGDTHPPTMTTVNQGLSGVKYTNIAGNGTTTREIEVEATVDNVSDVVIGSLCFLGGLSTGTHTNAGYRGNARLTGTETGGGAGRIGVFFE